MTRDDLLRRRRAFIFDLDGTLVDTAPCHAEAFSAVLQDEGVTGFVYAEFAGRRTDDVFRTVLGRAGRSASAAHVATLVRRKRDKAVELIERHPALLPGAAAFLDACRGAGKRLAVATSASRTGAETSLRANGLDGLFEAIVTGDDVARAKPAPDIFEAALDRLACVASDCIVFEDSEAGYAAARSAGLDVIVVAPPGSARPGWLPADDLVADFAALAAALAP